jgi:5'-nucleotidase
MRRLASALAAVTTAGLISLPAFASAADVVGIADIQGTGDSSPLAGTTVTTRGVVTAAYPTGGFSGVYMQTPGTGGDVDLDTHDASDGIFVFSGALAADVQVGDHVEVTGRVSEFHGLTEISPPAGSWTVLDEPAEAVKPAAIDFPLDDAQRESLEGMLLRPSGDYTITNNFTTNQYAEIGLAAGDDPLPAPTNIARPGSAEYGEVVADNARRLVTLDDGASTNFLSAANQGTPLPWLRPDNEVRVGAPTSFTAPMVLDYRNDIWKLQPTDQLVAGDAEPVTFGDTRKRRPRDVGGALQIATFNVLNYFTTLGEDFAASGAGTCTYFRDRAGANVTVNSCTNDGPRGAANAENLERQQAKIVAAINRLGAGPHGADVLSLEEIENSAAFGIDRDTALRNLVTALNADAGRHIWAYVPSPSRVPEVEDVIRTAFIYRTSAVKPVKESTILDDPAFDNAREPLAQEFRPRLSGSKHDFVVIVNHFKSKGSGTGEDADQGDGQGASNASRVKQARALVGFADAQRRAAKTDTVFLTGDFNAYNEEDPVEVIEDADYVNVPRALTDKETYQFDGLIGSLDHVFASRQAFRQVTGADIWNINAYESVGREYSRYNANVTNLYAPGPYRASDHDPEIVGFNRSR